MLSRETCCSNWRVRYFSSLRATMTKMASS
jgi:hypothetical protein